MGKIVILLHTFIIASKQCRVGFERVSARCYDLLMSIGLGVGRGVEQVACLVAMTWDSDNPGRGSYCPQVPMIRNCHAS